MKLNFGPLTPLRPAILAFTATALFTPYAFGISLERAKDSLECTADGTVLWRFAFGTNLAKPCFHPLAVIGSDSLTAFRPSDHRWHYGLWFSWKYINHVNYWEEDKTGRSDGTTRWSEPKITTQANGAAEIKMDLQYVSPSNVTMMTEAREILISAPRGDGSVTIDWIGKFTAGDVELVLDRTPMPGEDYGAVNGGYAGLSVRAAQSPAVCEFVTTDGPVGKFESDRARPNSQAAACNVTQGSRTDGIAIFSDRSNLGGDSPWYMVNSKSMHWFSPVLLAPAPKKVKPHESFTWKFHIITHKGPWTPEGLRAAAQDYK